jgi:hypothetical protein
VIWVYTSGIEGFILSNEGKYGVAQILTEMQIVDRKLCFIFSLFGCIVYICTVLVKGSRSGREQSVSRPNGGLYSSRWEKKRSFSRTALEQRRLKVLASSKLSVVPSVLVPDYYTLTKVNHEPITVLLANIWHGN